MRILYIADDGTEFENEVDCTFYEKKIEFPYISDVIVLNKDYKRLTKFLELEYYVKGEYIYIPSEEALNDFIKIAAECDYDDYYEYIDSTGWWKWVGRAFTEVGEKPYSKLNQDEIHTLEKSGVKNDRD